MFKFSQASSILAACLMSAGTLPAFAQVDSQNASEFNAQVSSNFPTTFNAEQGEAMFRGGPGGGGPGRPGPGGPGRPGGGFPGGGRPGPGGPGGGWRPGPGRPGPGGPGGGWRPGPGRPGPGGGYWPVPGPRPGGFYQCSAQNGYGQVYYGTAYDTGTAQQVAMNQCYQFSNFNCFPTGCIWR